MEVSVSNQLYVFFVMVLCGACAGVLFDLLRALRRAFGANAFTTSLGDILFWLIISIGVYMTIFMFNYGQIRWHEIIGIILGSVIYFLAFSRAIMKIMELLFKFFTKIFQIIFKIVLTPLIFLYKMIKRPLYYILGKMGRVFHKSKTKMSGFLGKMLIGIKKFALVLRKS